MGKRQLIIQNKYKQEYMQTKINARIYTNKIENRITFKTKTRYYLELLTPGKNEITWK